MYNTEDKITCNYSKILLALSKMLILNTANDDLEYSLRIYKKFEMFDQIVMQSDLGAYQMTFDDPSDNIKSLIDKILFKNQYQETGLVASSDNTIRLLMVFLSAKEKDLRSELKGKGKSNFGMLTESVFEASKECLETRNFQSCMRLIQLLSERQLSSTKEISQDVLDISEECSILLLNNVVLY